MNAHYSNNSNNKYYHQTKQDALKSDPQSADDVFITQLLDDVAPHSASSLDEEHANTRRVQSQGGAWIALHRLRLGYTSEQLANKTGVAPNVLMLLEAGLADSCLLATETLELFCETLATDAYSYEWMMLVVETTMGNGGEWEEYVGEILAMELSLTLDMDGIEDSIAQFDMAEIWNDEEIAAALAEEEEYYEQYYGHDCILPDSSAIIPMPDNPVLVIEPQAHIPDMPLQQKRNPDYLTLCRRFGGKLWYNIKYWYWKHKDTFLLSSVSTLAATTMVVFILFFIGLSRYVSFVPDSKNLVLQIPSTPVQHMIEKTHGHGLGEPMLQIPHEESVGIASIDIHLDPLLQTMPPDGFTPNPTNVPHHASLVYPDLTIAYRIERYDTQTVVHTTLNAGEQEIASAQASHQALVKVHTNQFRQRNNSFVSDVQIPTTPSPRMVSAGITATHILTGMNTLVHMATSFVEGIAITHAADPDLIMSTNLVVCRDDGGTIEKQSREHIPIACTETYDLSREPTSDDYYLNISERMRVHILLTTPQPTDPPPTIQVIPVHRNHNQAIQPLPPNDAHMLTYALDAGKYAVHVVSDNDNPDISNTMNYTLAVVLEKTE